MLGKIGDEPLLDLPVGDRETEPEMVPVDMDVQLGRILSTSSLRIEGTPVERPGASPTEVVLHEATKDALLGLQVVEHPLWQVLGHLGHEALHGDFDVLDEILLVVLVDDDTRVLLEQPEKLEAALG